MYHFLLIITKSAAKLIGPNFSPFSFSFLFFLYCFTSTFPVPITSIPLHLRKYTCASTNETRCRPDRPCLVCVLLPSHFYCYTSFLLSLFYTIQCTLVHAVHTCTATLMASIKPDHRHTPDPVHWCHRHYLTVLHHRDGQKSDQQSWKKNPHHLKPTRPTANHKPNLPVFPFLFLSPVCCCVAYFFLSFLCFTFFSVVSICTVLPILACHFPCTLCTVYTTINLQALLCHP